MKEDKRIEADRIRQEELDSIEARLRAKELESLRQKAEAAKALDARIMAKEFGTNSDVSTSKKR